MGQSRSERPLLPANNLPVQMEVLRQAADSNRQAESGKEESKIPLFWRVFGGTVLSITALVVMTAYQGLAGNIGDLGKQMEHLETDVRKEMRRLSELHGELVKKEECESRIKSVMIQVNDVREDRKALLDVQDRCQQLLESHRQAQAHRSITMKHIQEIRERRAMDQHRGELRDEVARLRERLSSLESRQVLPMPNAE